MSEDERYKFWYSRFYWSIELSALALSFLLGYIFGYK